MSTIVLTADAYGPYETIRTEKAVDNLTSLMKITRDAFEENVDAIAVIQDGNVVGLWINEPDVDCDSDGFFEVAPAYAGQQFNLYRPEQRRFWNAFAYHFGIKYVPHDVGFTIEKHIAA